jgi:hypothetical protein
MRDNCLTAPSVRVMGSMPVFTALMSVNIFNFGDTGTQMVDK